jgi:SagB-type dehydrogenase family enzyme
VFVIDKAMGNQEISHSRDFHEFTKHSEVSIQTPGHRLDFGNKPNPFKFYTKLPSIPLPTVFSKPEAGTLTAISRIGSVGQLPSEINIMVIAEILFFTAGVTRSLQYDTDTIYMRAASATGALYPIELYLVCEDLSGLKAGVYHFNPGDFSLTLLREGDYRLHLSEAAGDDTSIQTSPAVIVFSSIAWRNAWKYRDRSYRHWFWDSGVMAANLLATVNSIGLCINFNVGFFDDVVNRLVCVENRQEAVIALAPIGVGQSKKNTSNNNKDVRRAEISILKHETLPLSEKGQVEYPMIWKIHEASNLQSKDEVKKWIDADKIIKQNSTTRASILDSIPLLPANFSNDPPLSDIILLRGSSRRFARKPISFVQLCNILHSSATGIPLDFTKGCKVSITDAYFIANEVEGLPRGSYYFNRNSDSLDLLKRDVHRDVSGYLCLWQSLFSDASIVFFLMTPLEQVIASYGNRGYRAVQFEAGIIAGKIYLAAYAQGIGASGSTFFDDAVTEFFSPHATDKSTMIAIGVGVPGYKSKSGKVLAGKWTRDQLLPRVG